jgi:ATP:ADP antiporter, AAA family
MMTEPAPAPAERRTTLIRVVALSALAFLIMLSYSIARPAAESLFLESQTSARLPLVWLLVAALAAVVVPGYAWLMARVELLRLFGATAAASGVVLAALIVIGGPVAPYGLYAWKDLYIVLLIETFYSCAAAVFPIRRARWLYGLFGVVSSLGSIAGNLAVGWLALRVGTGRALWAVLPVVLLMWLLCIPLSRRAGISAATAEPSSRPPGPGLAEAFAVVRSSAYLVLLVVLVAVVQVVVNLIDYEFNRIVEGAFPVTDQRTAAIGQVYAAIDVLTIVLHGLTGPLLRLLGVPVVLLIVPCLLGAGICAFAAAPRFATAALVKIASKCFDYTIFRAAKEVLYIPLSFHEKTQGKSVVDVLTYRVAKGAASAVLLGLQRLALAALVTPMALAFVGVWLGLTVAVARRFRRKVSREEELKGSA